MLETPPQPYSPPPADLTGDRVEWVVMRALESSNEGVGYDHLDEHPAEAAAWSAQARRVIRDLRLAGYLPPE